MGEGREVSALYCCRSNTGATWALTRVDRAGLCALIEHEQGRTNEAPSSGSLRVVVAPEARAESPDGRRGGLTAVVGAPWLCERVASEKELRCAGAAINSVSGATVGGREQERDRDRE